MSNDATIIDERIARLERELSEARAVRRRERAAEIRAQLKAGRSATSLAKERGISRQRLYRMLKEGADAGA